jgi:hypothetical protein
MACLMLCGPGMIRHAADRLTRSRAQRRFLAAGIRVRGQWRYLVRASNDPFTLGDDSPRATATDGETRLGKRHPASPQERA